MEGIGIGSIAMSNRRGPPTIVSVFLLVVGCAALALFGLVTHDWYTASVSQNWPVVAGKIVYAGLRGGYFAAGRGIAHAEHAAIDYQYTVRGRDYTAHDVYLGLDYENPQQTVQRYPVGTNVIVHYDPQKPSTAVLEPGLGLNRMQWFGTVVFYSAWIGFGVLCVFNGLGALFGHKRHAER